MTAISVSVAYNAAVAALRVLAAAADAAGPCSEESRARDALEALGESREAAETPDDTMEE